MFFYQVNPLQQHLAEGGTNHDLVSVKADLFRVYWLVFLQTRRSTDPSATDTRQQARVTGHAPVTSAALTTRVEQLATELDEFAQRTELTLITSGETCITYNYDF